MAGAFEATQAIKDPTKFAALGMGARQMTGMWTQRSPYRDANVPYLYGKFYSAGRFDSILDGINREISMRLTDVRRPGSYLYNTNTFPAANSFYSFKCVQATTEVVRVILDGMDGNIYDATAGQKTLLFAKSAGGAALGWKARFLGVGTELFFSDRVEQKKWLFNQSWPGVSQQVEPGTLINSGAEPGHAQMALGGITMNVIATQCATANTIIVFFDPQAIPDQFANLLNANITFSGLTSATFLNGNTYAVQFIPSSTLGILWIHQTHATYAKAFEGAGQGTTGSGLTGGSLPAFSSTEFVITADNGQQWKCYGPTIQNWGLQPIQKAPVLIPLNGTTWWTPRTLFPAYTAIVDSAGNIQVSLDAGGTGNYYPTFGAVGQITADGMNLWRNAGPPQAWQAAFDVTGYPAGVYSCILDSNGNIQQITATTGGSLTGGSQPTWGTGIGTTTADNDITWTCCGPGVIIATGTVQYSFSTHAIDGSVSTAAPVAVIPGGILGPGPGIAGNIQLTGYFTFDTQMDQFWIWRTPQGQATLILEDQIPIDGYTTSFNYDELDIPDTSTNGNGALNALIPAPVAQSNNPPQTPMTAPVYHLNRIWAILNNTVVYSGGPDTITGNGNTAFPPLNSIPYVGQPLRLVPITVENGGLLVFTTSGIQIILGTGTASNPFYSTQYCDKVNLANYDALDVLGTVIYLMESNAKVSSIAVQYPFNPQSGYTEVGFPIGDQFLKVTTGGISSALYNPATSFLSWNILNSTDTAMYVADGQVGWFRMSNVAPPESGLLWSPRAQVTGQTSAVQSVETAPGVFNLLIAPYSSGPITKRDDTGTVFTDYYGTAMAYPAWDAKGVTLLCSTGQIAELGWIATKSKLVGARPQLGLMMNEVAPTASMPWNVLQWTTDDPTDLPKSQSAFSDRYSCEQNSFIPKGDCCYIKFDYGTQGFGDELEDFQIYGAKEEERVAQ